MLPKEIIDLLEEVFEYFGEQEKKEAQKEPEVYLVSLLSKIKEDLPDVSAMLEFTVEEATYHSHLDEARAKLNLAKKKAPKKVAARSR